MNGPTDPKPMTKAALRRLMAPVPSPEAELWQRLQEAEARGRLTGLLLIRRTTR